MPRPSNSIVLIHGLWMTALSWEQWVEHYAAKGFQVVAKSWPGMDIPIEQFRQDPSPIATLGVTEVVDHYEKIIGELESPPIIIGHSFGGLIARFCLTEAWAPLA